MKLRIQCFKLFFESFVNYNNGRNKVKGNYDEKKEKIK